MSLGFNQCQWTHFFSVCSTLTAVVFVQLRIPLNFLTDFLSRGKCPKWRRTNSLCDDESKTNDQLNQEKNRLAFVSHPLFSLSLSLSFSLSLSYSPFSLSSLSLYCLTSIHSSGLLSSSTKKREKQGNNAHQRVKEERTYIYCLFSPHCCLSRAIARGRNIFSDAI